MTDLFDAQLLAALPKLRKHAVKLTGSVERADDLLQEAATKALSNRDKFEVGSNMAGWLYLIMRNHHYTSWGRAKRQVDDFDEVVRTLRHDEAPEERIFLREVLDRVALMPEAMREAVRLVLIEGLTYAEAAAQLGCEEGTIKSRVFRARSTLNIHFIAAEAV